jgi:hypothetical protein
MIYVTQDGHHRRARLQLRSIFPGDHLSPERHFAHSFFDFFD